jgi:hypothetical protein
MLELKNDQDNITFSLTTTGYTNKDEEWLNIQIQVSRDEKKFSASGAYLEAVDIWTIADWFRFLFKRRLPSEASLYFIKSHISFHYITSSKGVILSVALGDNLKLDIEPQQTLPNSDINSNWRLEKIIKRGGQDPYDYKNQLYFEIKPQEFPGIIYNLKTVGYKYPPYRNLGSDDLKNADED